jgi:hypothetical protein
MQSKVVLIFNHFFFFYSPSVVGMLWEVTDIDCDRFTVRFLDLWLGARQQTKKSERNATTLSILELPPPPDTMEPELLRAVAASRDVTKNFLTGAAVVVYGPPVTAADV